MESHAYVCVALFASGVQMAMPFVLGLSKKIVGPKPHIPFHQGFSNSRASRPRLKDLNLRGPVLNPRRSGGRHDTNQPNETGTKASLRWGLLHFIPQKVNDPNFGHSGYVLRPREISY